MKGNKDNMIKNKRKAIIVDIDGTLALMKGVRDPFDHDKVHYDLPNKPIIDLVKTLVGPDPKCRQIKDLDVFIFSGRMNVPFDTKVDSFSSVQNATVWWLDKHLGFDYWDFLDMRQNKDYRKDSVIKKEFYNNIKDTHDVLWVIDDRQQVVDMWRDDLGLTVLQVGKGDF